MSACSICNKGDSDCVGCDCACHKWQYPLPAASCKPSRQVHANGGRFEDETSYTSQYLGATAPRRSAYRGHGSTLYMPSGKLGADTTNRSDFTEFAGHKPSTPFKPKREDTTQVEARNFQTESAVQFNDKGYQHRVSKKPLGPSNTLPTGQFAGESVSKSDFGWKTSERAPPVKPNLASNVSLGSDDSRDFISENQMRFQVPQNPVKSQLMRPGLTIVSTAKFEGVPESRAAYPEYVGAKKAELVVPLKSSLGDPNTRFDDSTSYGSTFTGMVQPRRATMFPSNSTFKSTAKFDGTTTNKQDFTGSTYGPAESMRPERVREEQKESRNFQTESAIQFNDKGFQKRAARKPVHGAIQLGDAKFVGESQAKADFTWKQQQARPTQFRPKNEIQLETADGRDWQTTSSMNFTGVTAPRQPTLKPTTNVHYSSAKMAGLSAAHEHHTNFWERPCVRLTNSNGSALY